ncbi:MULTISPECIES: AAA family ATPase [unclassified Ruegeria]|uniref:AAA family ATPase n=1 Tax=unclassified Ruegeria TaxID=2625375 RepID=UPI00147C10B2|nr:MULTISPECIES: AAA family ATPase [unclassified Ruegeria]NOD62036.1 AAA family ATPase [Ruegeria sp. HKCCD6109]
MKLKFVEMSGFRGYCEPVRIDFGADATIIDGRNGVGKSTIFDAVEFALTGSIAKYQDAKANQETVDDYIWWLGEDEGPDERYVKVGFILNGSETVVTRSSLQPTTAENIEMVVSGLINEDAAPSAALHQVCSSTIIRDEHIAALSLDLKETERYSILSSAIGAIGADEWIAKAKEIHDTSKKELKAATERSERAKADAVRSQIELDRWRARTQNDRHVQAALRDAESVIGRRLPIDEAFGLVGHELERFHSNSSRIRSLLERYSEVDKAKIARAQDEVTAADLASSTEAIASELELKNTTLASIDLSTASDVLASRLSQLAALGEDIGCQDDTCPLCKSNIDESQYRAGIAALRESAETINAEIARATTLRNEVAELELRLANQKQRQEQSIERLNHHDRTIAEATKAIEELGFSADTDRTVVEIELEQLSSQIEKLKTALPELDMNRFSASLERASNAYAEELDRDRDAERALSRARQKEADAKELFDSVRKASNDALNQRLDRILPLITELYARLRPHPNFQDIKYKIRGELRRHLSFSVGDDINPQFVFSSGQRRATGLAFLIAVNLSMAWSRWSSILLDDPVQHIDDFRSVHLAELLGKLVSEGKQVICAVEDPALADLISRKIPVSGSGVAKRIKLGIGENGRVVVSDQSDLLPMRSSVLIDQTSNRAG